MNKDTKVLSVALMIILIGAFSLNYTNITGRQTRDISEKSTVSVNPKAVKAGESINIEVNPGKQGVYQELDIYRVGKNNMKLSEYSPLICRSSKCFETSVINYKILEGWDNNDEWDYGITSKDYFVRVYDIYSGTYAKSYFTVERAYPAAGPQEHR